MAAEPTYTFPESFLRQMCEELEQAPAVYVRRALNAIEGECQRQNAVRVQRKQQRPAKAEKK